MSARDTKDLIAVQRNLRRVLEEKQRLLRTLKRLDKAVSALVPPPTDPDEAEAELEAALEVAAITIKEVES